MSHRTVVGYYENEEDVLAAVRATREAGYVIRDVFTPFAVHGMDEALGLKPSRLTFVCFGAGLFGLISALALQYYASVVSWPLNVGGKPFNSLPAFIPVAFEVTVLFAGLTTVAAFLLLTRTLPGARKLRLPRVCDDRFAILLAPSERGLDLLLAERHLRELGAAEVVQVEVGRP